MRKHLQFSHKNNYKISIYYQNRVITWDMCFQQLDRTVDDIF